MQPQQQDNTTQAQSPLEQQPELSTRDQLVQDLMAAPTQPDLAQTVYKQLGINAPEVRLHGVQASVGDLKPGDLVGWNGGHQPDGRYVGNIAIYAGGGEIIEQFYGQQRRRKINPQEDTFGMPVYLPEDDTNFIQ